MLSTKQRPIMALRLWMEVRAAVQMILVLPVHSGHDKNDGRKPQRFARGSKIVSLLVAFRCICYSPSTMQELRLLAAVTTCPTSERARRASAPQLRSRRQHQGPKTRSRSIAESGPGRLLAASNVRVCCLFTSPYMPSFPLATTRSC